MKRCRICHRDLPLTEFPPHKQHSDGLNSRCRDCDREYHRAYYYRRAAKKLEKRDEAKRGRGENAFIDCRRCKLLATCRAHINDRVVIDNEVRYWPLPCWAEHPHTLTAAELQISRASVDRLEEVMQSC